MINVNYKKDLTIQCRENLNLLSDEYMLELADDTFRHIDEELLSLASMLDSHLSKGNACRKPRMYGVISSLTLKAFMLSDLITKSAKEYVSLDILKVLLEDETDIFHEGNSVKIETLADDSLRISAVNKREPRIE